LRIATKKREGACKGRLPTIDLDMLAQLRSGGLGVTEIARSLKIGREADF
jgi:hypothetical protein